MNVQTITMDPAEARAKLKDYRTALHRSADEEYRAVAAGLEQLGMGYPLINYSAAIREAPTDEKGRPLLALARADRRQVRVDKRWLGAREVRYSTVATAVGGWVGPSADEYARSYPAGLLVRSIDLGEPREIRDGYALVPLVPADVINQIGGTSKLRDYLVLWDVEAWSDTVIGARPDIDPLLLKPIHGDLCAVVAQWDLTELERAVMAGRAVL